MTRSGKPSGKAPKKKTAAPKKVAPPSGAASWPVSVTNRIIAKLIDLFVFFVLAAVLPQFLGPLVGFTYSLLADGMNFGNFEGQSIGKKLMGLRVMNHIENRPADFRDSLRRNAPVGVATFFALIPVWGWVILFLVGIPLMAIEVYLIVRVEKGQRLGDVMADTEVIALPPAQAAGGRPAL